jgi:hypothetical protein
MERADTEISQAASDVASPGGSRNSPENILHMLRNDEGFRVHLPFRGPAHWSSCTGDHPAGRRPLITVNKGH